jgi:hypothetical protein
MKNTRLTLSLLFVVGALTGVHAGDAKEASRTEVNFANPEKFTDAADGQRGSDFGRDANLQELREYIQKRADAILPEGQRLTVTVTDVDFAGEVEPWRTPQMNDARLVKEIYPPRINLDFRLTDASGAVIKEGNRRLTDLTFMMNLHGPDRSERRVYERDLLDKWLRQEFGRAKKK